MKPVSKHRFCGSIVDPQTNRALLHKNDLQAKFLHMTLIDETVDEVFDRPPSVPYLNHDGEEKTCNFDYLVVYANGDRIAYCVAYNVVAEKFRIKDRLLQVSSQMPQGYANKLRLRTEEHITTKRAYNASVLFAVSANDVDQLHPAFVKVALSLQGTTQISALLDATKETGAAFRSVSALIRMGYLEIADNSGLSFQTYVRCVKGGDK